MTSASDIGPPVSCTATPCVDVAALAETPEHGGDAVPVRGSCGTTSAVGGRSRP